jgi:hypothetical protein
MPVQPVINHAIIAHGPCPSAACAEAHADIDVLLPLQNLMFPEFL